MREIEDTGDAELEVYETMNRLRALRKALEPAGERDNTVDGVGNALADCVEHLDRVAIFLEKQ